MVDSIYIFFDGGGDGAKLWASQSTRFQFEHDTKWTPKSSNVYLKVKEPPKVVYLLWKHCWSHVCHRLRRQCRLVAGARHTWVAIQAPTPTIWEAYRSHHLSESEFSQPWKTNLICVVAISTKYAPVHSECSVNGRYVLLQYSQYSQEESAGPFFLMIRATCLIMLPF